MRLPILLLAGAVALAACTSATPSPSLPASPSIPTAPPSMPPSDAPSSPSPVPTPEPPAFGDWEELEVPETQGGTSATRVFRGGDGFVVIGFDGQSGTIVWTSADGRTWRDVTPEGFASVGIVNVVAHDGRFVGVGRGTTTDVDAQQAAVYLSDDGLAWRRVDAPLVGQMIDVVATDDGLYAVGGVPGADAAGIWFSADGEAWERIGGEFPAAFMWAIAEGGPGLVVVGWRRNPEPDLAVWVSADGATWELAPDPEGIAGYEATDVLALADGSLVMVGGAHLGGPGRMWHSRDGLTWTLAEAEGAEAATPRTLARVDGGVVALGGGEDMAARAWFSADGRSWALINEPLPEAFFESALATDEGLIVVGIEQTGTVETGIDGRARVFFAPFPG